MADKDKEIIRQLMGEGLNQLTPDKLKEILKKIREGKAVKRGGTVSRKRGKKIMQGYKAGGKV